jgi:hypothetical protein
MAYTLEAVIGPTTVLSVAAQDQACMVIVPLRQGLSLVPMTDQLFDELTDGSPSLSPGYWKFPGGFDRVLCRWSSTGPIAYIEAEYFGGVGRQCSAVWDSGTLVFGPAAIDEGPPGPDAYSPISQALARLGVARGGHHDEFEAVGLGQHRRTDDWSLPNLAVLGSRAAPAAPLARSVAGLCAAAPARHGRAAAGQLPQINPAHSDGRYCAGPSSSASIVQLAGTASRPPCGRRCAMASPA